MNAFGPQRIVVAIIILVIAGFLGAVLSSGDEPEESVPVTVESEPSDTAG